VKARLCIRSVPATGLTSRVPLVATSGALAWRIVLLGHGRSRIVVVLHERLVLLLLLLFQAVAQNLILTVLIILLGLVSCVLLLQLGAAVFLDVSLATSELGGVAFVVLRAVRVLPSADAGVPFEVGVARLLKA